MVPSHACLTISSFVPNSPFSTQSPTSTANPMNQIYLLLALATFPTISIIALVLAILAYIHTERTRCHTAQQIQTLNMEVAHLQHQTAPTPQLSPTPPFQACISTPCTTRLSPLPLPYESSLRHSLRALLLTSCPLLSPAQISTLVTKTANAIRFMHHANITTSTAYQNDVVAALYGILSGTGKYVDAQQRSAVLNGFRGAVRDLMGDERGSVEEVYFEGMRNEEGDDRGERVSSEDEVSGTSSYPSSLSSTNANLSGTTLVGQDSRGQTPVLYNDSSSNSTSDLYGGGVGGPIVERHYRPAEFDFGVDGDDENED